MKEQRIQIIKRIINQILLEISDVEYNIDLSRLKLLYDRKHKMQIILNDKDNKTMQYNFYYEDNGNFYGSINIKNFERSFLMEYPPQYRKGELININPILNIANYDDETTFLLSTYHEVTHFISSGSWNTIQKGDKSIIEHISGISVDRYYYNKEKVTTIESNNMEFINEAINDWISKYLYSLIEKKKISNDDRYKKINMQIKNKIQNGEIKAKDIISYYISNEISKLKEGLSIEDFYIGKAKGERE